MSIPTLAEFEYEIGARMSRGDFVGATAAAAACRVAWPSSGTGWLLGSFAALCDGNAAEALTLVEHGLAVDPGDLQCLLQRVECLIALGRGTDASVTAARLVSHPRADAAALEALGQSLVNAHEYHQASRVYDRAVGIAPGSVPIRAKRASLHRLLGNFREAAADYEAVLRISPLHPDALKSLVDLEPQSQQSNRLPQLQAALAGAPAESEAAAVLNFALAKTFEDLREYSASWRHLSAANRLERARSDYRPENDQAVIEEIIAGFAEPEPLHPDTTRERPIFIVGLPRTGTTLVERILGNHSRVHAAGELAALSQTIGSAVNRRSKGRAGDWREFAAHLRELDGETIAREYLALSLPQRGNRERFLDKQTTNFFYCALIFRAFPRAHIVHVTRHPLATCHALYKIRFDAGFPFAYDLNDLADFYLGYRRLMAHWERVLPGKIINVSYEDLVTAQEATTRRLLEALELGFEPACLDFHRNPAPTTNTASAAQVRRSMYDSSLHQWRHYSQQLMPLRARLEAGGIQVDGSVA
jgi:tetratricopeptide (TPR) repeat protein